MTASNHTTLVSVGTITAEASGHFTGAHGNGIITLALDPQTGRIEHRHEYRDALSPTFLACIPGERQLFATECNLVSSGRLMAFEYDATGKLSLTDSQPTHGMAGCHLCMLPGNSGICHASYIDACIDAFALKNGKMITPGRYYSYQGSGPNAGRQEAAHAHHVAVDPSGKWLYVCDLGSDCIWIHDLKDGLPALSPRSIKAPAGYGPRHMVFHPSLPLTYVVCELSGRVLLYAWDKTSGVLKLIHDVSGLPEGWNGLPAASAIIIHRSAGALYVSQRNHHSLAVYRLGSDGVPSLAQHLPCGVLEPRDCAFDPSGRWLIVANQNSNNLAVFEIDPTSGMPTGKSPHNCDVATPASVLCV